DVHLLEEDAYYTVTIKDEWGHVYETLEVKHGENFVPTVTPSKEGYIFVGYNPGLSHVVVSNMDVLVVHQQITFNVIFRNHEGTVIKQMTVNYGDDAIAPQYNAPEGFEFVGWNGSFENVTSNLIIDAVIKPLVYEIKLFGNGGLFGTEELLVIEKNFQETVGIPTQPTRLGYTFAGWYFNPEGTGNSYQFSAG